MLGSSLAEFSEFQANFAKFTGGFLRPPSCDGVLVLGGASEARPGIVYSKVTCEILGRAMEKNVLGPRI